MTPLPETQMRVQKLNSILCNECPHFNRFPYVRSGSAEQLRTLPFSEVVRRGDGGGLSVWLNTYFLAELKSAADQNTGVSAALTAERSAGGCAGRMSHVEQM